MKIFVGQSDLHLYMSDSLRVVLMDAPLRTPEIRSHVSAAKRNFSRLRGATEQAERLVRPNSYRYFAVDMLLGMLVLKCSVCAESIMLDQMACGTVGQMRCSIHLISIQRFSFFPSNLRNLALFL